MKVENLSFCLEYELGFESESDSTPESWAESDSNSESWAESKSESESERESRQIWNQSQQMFGTVASIASIVPISLFF